MDMYTSLEICAGAGGQALGLEQAGFEHCALVEYEREYCDCLKENRPGWHVICGDVRQFDGRDYHGKIDLLSGGVPCPPFSIAGKQLGRDDERDLFPEMLRLVEEISPKTVLIENVKGLMSPKFDRYREQILLHLDDLGYSSHISMVNSADFGVPQSRIRVLIVGIRKDIKDTFRFPSGDPFHPLSVGEALYDLVAENDWNGAAEWKEKADAPAPTLVGGSKKHGGPDLGPTRARTIWEKMGVDGRGIGDDSPTPDHDGLIRLTTRMLARIQGFPDDWVFCKGKTKACRMIGNAFPPPVARAVGIEIINVLNDAKFNKKRQGRVSRILDSQQGAYDRP